MLTPSIFRSSFDDFFPTDRFFKFNEPVSNVMKTDIKESDKGFDLAIELPGYNKEDVKAELKDGYMTISAEASKQNDEKDEEGSYIRRERYYGACSRSFYVGKDIKKEDIEAKFENGILKLFVPKKDAVVEETDHLISIM